MRITSKRLIFPLIKSHDLVANITFPVLFHFN